MMFVRSVIVGALLTFAVTASAAPSYGSQGGYTVTAPYDPGSFSTVLTAFPRTTSRLIDGYPAAGRMVAATGRTLYLLQTFGKSDWLPMAVLSADDPAMDPAFAVVSPDGEKWALGTGAGKPLYVFPTSLLSVEAPVVLTGNPAAQRFDLYYFDAVFRDRRYLFVNAGGATLGESYIFVVDTDALTSRVFTIIDKIPGASGGVTFDAAGDLITGIGWDPDSENTGELRIFPAALIDAALAGGTSLDYDTDGLVLARGMLSAASLGVDGEGNLYVGGGDVFGTTGHYGYANLIDDKVIDRVLAGGAPLDASNPDELTKIAPDPCENDDATSVVYVPGVDMLVVSANMASTPPMCEPVDWSTGPSGPRTVYFPPDAPDSDGDGVPDGMDPDYGTRRMIDRGALSRLVNALDSVTGDANFDVGVDYDDDGRIGDSDVAFLRVHWGQPSPK